MSAAITRGGRRAVLEVVRRCVPALGIAGPLGDPRDARRGLIDNAWLDRIPESCGRGVRNGPYSRLAKRFDVSAGEAIAIFVEGNSGVPAGGPLPPRGAAYIRGYPHYSVAARWADFARRLISTGGSKISGRVGINHG